MKANNTPLDFAPLQDPRFANTLELAVRFGKALVVSDVDRIEPLLYPLLRRDLERQGPRMVVALGDKLVGGRGMVTFCSGSLLMEHSASCIYRGC